MKQKNADSATVNMCDWVLYIIQAKSGKLYTGITNDLERRLLAHKSNNGARFFHFSAPDKILYHEKHPNRSEASKREFEVKKLSRKEKLALCTQIPEISVQ
ncbi:MAG TPA: GIY-YIG nuclease family protein [Parachlamydiaceae bacterium]|nr:GIY-YIG nuclease family protein [Parachlamydiaceae bacterium]